jgi:hypothetical protein
MTVIAWKVVGGDALLERTLFGLRVSTGSRYGGSKRQENAAEHNTGKDEDKPDEE